jgi:hypothetical protein
MSTPIVTPLKPNAQAVSDFWRVLVWPGDVHEIRIRDTRRGPARLFGTASGYFDDTGAVVRAVTPITGRDAACVYVTLNPVNPDLVARSCNRLKNKVEATSSNSDVVWRRTLLI